MVMKLYKESIFLMPALALHMRYTDIDYFSIIQYQRMTR